MAVTTIDGVVEAAEPARRKGKYVLFSTVRVRDAGGTEHTLTKVAAADPVAAALKPGAKGRLYVTRALDQTGVHGVRLDDGVSAYAHFNNMELILLVGVAAGVLTILMALAGSGGLFPVLGFILAPVLTFVWWLFRKARLEGASQFQADAERS